jgi:hypothetical protein
MFSNQAGIDWNRRRRRRRRRHGGRLTHVVDAVGGAVARATLLANVPDRAIAAASLADVARQLTPV